jgi:START domain
MAQRHAEQRRIRGSEEGGRAAAAVPLRPLKHKATAPAGAAEHSDKQQGNFPGVALLLAPLHVLQFGAALLLGGRQPTHALKQPGDVTLTRREREQRFLAERRVYAAEETRALFLIRNDLERQRTAEFFNTFRSERWQFEEERSDGTEVWRLPGARIHTIMGVHTVNTSPKTALDMFADPKAVFRKVFPKVDTMFITGQVMDTKGSTLCAATFKLPNLVGNGSAPGFPPREFIWRQFVTRLATGNVLVTASTGNENKVHKQVIHRGSVRGTLLTSGYYGRKLPGSPSRTRVFYIASADPAGVIPAWLVNFAAGKQAGNVTRLAQLFQTGTFQG